ncbi:Solute carrier family 2, facilitated glucose transporter member 3 [Liparis tanakae]|uniref:Solute carrier family 2, facilitated glucose transporter member 3 n=1 Tax=Liparis tanakae TaxID=230148 RepID=A0A4Z2GU48_9TELE|nr:Solute carrier family 2, facilitated glucose transporter member 3 [Liparis tanakae]
MGFLIFFFIFTFLKVPETRGKTFDEIARCFGGDGAGRPASSSIEAPPASASTATTLTASPVKEKLPLVAAAAAVAPPPASETTPLQEKAKPTANDSVEL